MYCFFGKFLYKRIFGLFYNEEEKNNTPATANKHKKPTKTTRQVCRTEKQRDKNNDKEERW